MPSIGGDRRIIRICRKYLLLLSPGGAGWRAGPGEAIANTCLIFAKFQDNAKHLRGVSSFYLGRALGGKSSFLLSTFRCERNSCRSHPGVWMQLVAEPGLETPVSTMSTPLQPIPHPWIPPKGPGHTTSSCHLQHLPGFRTLVSPDYGGVRGWLPGQVLPKLCMPPVSVIHGNLEI